MFAAVQVVLGAYLGMEGGETIRLHDKYPHKAFEEPGANGSKRYWASKSNDKVEPERIWLAASSFFDAIVGTHAIAMVRLNGQWMNLWASDGWDEVWATGPSECR